MADRVFRVLKNLKKLLIDMGGQIADERGLPAGDYYITLENISNGTSTGIYSLFWEERF